MESFPTINYVIRNLTIIVVIIIVYGVRNLTADCPNLCECKWKSGKESVVCLNANLTGIPTKLDASTQILDLTGNEVVNVPRDAFNNANLLNLQKIYIVRCRLKVIDRYAFRKLINLVELDLSYNSLTMIPSHAFESISELRVLSIIGNPIQRINNEAFANVPQLTRLELSNCKISMIELRAFIGVEATLERLNLDGNKLMEIRSLTFTLLRNLHSLELAGNPWNCSCNIRPLREWMLKENIPYDIPPTCKFPQRLAGKSWDKIELDEFACVPHILAPDIKAHGVEGKNVTMSCMVGGVPEPNVRWTVKNRVIANLSGNTMMPTAQGRKMYMVNLQQNASNLTILTAEVQDAGIYTCTAENKAGRVEASVTLAVSRKPPEAPLSARVLIASIIVASLIIIVLSLAVICICTLQKRKKIRRWHTHQGGRRTDSYEKIELNHKPHTQTLHLGYKGGSPKPDGNCFLKPYGENGISVVGHVRRNGDYRNVPSEDDGTGYEDNIESSNAMLSSSNATARRDNLHKWKGASNRNGSPPSTTTITSTTDQWKLSNDNNNIMDRPRIEDTDLHIPRLIEFSDATPDSESNSLSKHCESTNNINSSTTVMGSSLIADCINGNNTNYKITNNNWSSQNIMKNSGKHNNKNDIVYSTDNDAYTLKNIAGEQENDFDIDRKYPDLLDISSFNNNNTMGNNNNNNNNTNSGITISNILNNNNNNNNINSVTNASNTICTLPRKKNGNGRFLKNTSDSQSPLLPECLSRYGSSNNFTENNYSNDSFTPRRFSIDSYSNYPSSLSTKISSSSNNAININDKINNHHTAVAACSSGIRANSFLNLSMSSPKSIVKNHKRNPSLPTTPTREKPLQHTIFSPAATPLLDFSSFNIRNPMVHQSSNSPSSTVNAYDYHAAQLERFLEEYRNLQEQLCKMKQTCDSIRKKEHPVRNNNNNNNINTQSNLKLNESVIYSVASGGAGGLFITTNDNNNNNTTTTITTTTLNNTIDNINNTSTSSTSGSSKNNNNTPFPRNLSSRNKALLPGQTPEPPPYWLHRNVMFKKLQEQTDTDFYHQS